MKIYPNPCKNWCTIVMNDAICNDCELNLYDILGKEIRKIKVTDKRMILKRENIPDGLYFLRFISNNKTFTQKINFTN